MKFGPTSLDSAQGAILAHTIRLARGSIKKGTRLTPSDIERLANDGITEITVARLADGDILEDDAATRIAAAITGPHIDIANAATGRVNLYAATDGLLQVDAEQLIALNLTDEGLTVATLAPNERVAAGRMIATIKIIPYALRGNVVDTACRKLETSTTCLVSIAPFHPKRAGLIVTKTSATKPSVITKRREVNEKRITDLGSALTAHETVAHEASAVAAAITRMADQNLDPLLIFGASAIADREDVIPAALVAAGGTVSHFGMPVDPGNLLMLGELDGRTVIGVPSCASSPRLNGLDWVLERTFANLETTNADIARMAPGGLLMEIASRPQPREGTPISETATAPGPRIAALVLAAGRSTRMGERNKLTEEIDGHPMVRHVANAALAAKVDRVRIVTGNRPAEVQHALAGLDVTYTHNPNFAEGLSTSLAAGIAALEDDIDGAIVLLGDMPFITADLIDQLIAAFAPDNGRAICVPVSDGKRGNPILWARRFFDEITTIKGDTGAKHLIGQHSSLVTEIPADNPAIFQDIDTPEMLQTVQTKQP